MKSANVEAGAECAFSLRARLQDCTLAQIVRKGLSGPRNVAVDLGLDLMIGQCRVFTHVCECALTRPSLRVDAGIDHEPRGSPDLVAQHPEALVRGVIEAHLDAQTLA